MGGIPSAVVARAGIGIAHHEKPGQVDPRVRPGPDFPVDYRDHLSPLGEGVPQPKVTVDQGRSILPGIPAARRSRTLGGRLKVLVARHERGSPSLQ